MKKLATKPKTIDDYLSDFSPNVRRALNELRAAIKSAAPKAEEVISYGIPGYKQNGPLVFFAAQTKHLSFYVVNKEITVDYRKELKNFETTGTTIHFYPDKPISVPLVKKIVKRRVAENELRSMATIKGKGKL